MRTKPYVPGDVVRPRPPTATLTKRASGLKIDQKDCGTTVDRELTILIRYYQFDGMCSFETVSTLTVNQLIDLIKERVKPKKVVTEDPFLIKDGAVFLYKGQDLCQKDPMMTLAQLGMEEFVNILILYPGPFNEPVHIPKCSKSLQLKALAESARISAQAGTPMLEFLKKTGPADMKIIVESPATVRAISSAFLCLVVNGNDTIATLRTRISDTLHEDERSPLALIVENLYSILFNKEVLEDETLTLDQLEIKDGDRIMVCPNVSFFVTVIFVPIEVPYEKKLQEVRVLCSDTVGSLKTKISNLEGICPEKIILRFDEEWLADDEMLLLDYGIVDFPQAAPYGVPYSYMEPDYVVEAIAYA